MMVGLTASERKAIDVLCISIVESFNQAGADFCGEQREWHLPRLSAAFQAALTVFPEAMSDAMTLAKYPHGDPIVEEGD